MLCRMPKTEQFGLKLVRPPSRHPKTTTSTRSKTESKPAEKYGELRRTTKARELRLTAKLKKLSTVKPKPENNGHKLSKLQRAPTFEGWEDGRSDLADVDSWRERFSGLWWLAAGNLVDPDAGGRIMDVLPQ